MRKLFISLFLLLFFVQTASAGIEWRRFDFFDFGGGLNDGFADVNIADNEASDIQNLVFTTGGNIATRDGYAKLNSITLGASVICTGIFFYKLSDGTKYLVSVWDNDKIYKMDYGAGGGPDGTWDEITGSLTLTVGQNDLSWFAVGEDILIIEDGDNSTAPYKWTGAGNAAALSGSPPNATMVAFHKNMAFAAGNDSNPSTLYFTDVGDIENWTTGLSGNISIETNDGSVIRGIKPGFDGLYIWKDDSMWRLSGDDKDTFELQRMISDIGTLSGHSIVNLGNDFIFNSDEGDITLYDGAVKIRDISAKIEGTIDALAFNRFFYTPAVLLNDDYYIAVSTIGGSTNDQVLMFDTFHLAWTKFAGMNINAMAVAENANGEEIIVFGDYGGFAYEYPSGTDDAGTAISDFWITKQFRFPQITPEKYLRLLKVFANQKGNYNLNVEVRSDYEGTGTAYAIDLSGSSSLWGTAIYGTDVYGGENLIIDRIEPSKGENFFQLRFFNENADEEWELKGYQMFMEESERI